MHAFEPSDAWLFLALARSDGSSLAGFLAVADHLNRGPPAYQETCGSLGRLQAAGLLVPAHGWLALSDSGRKLFASVGGLSAPPMSQLIATGAALQSVTLPLADAAPFTLPRALFEYCVRAQVRTGA